MSAAFQGWRSWVAIEAAGIKSLRLLQLEGRLRTKKLGGLFRAWRGACLDLRAAEDNVDRSGSWRGPHSSSRLAAGQAMDETLGLPAAAPEWDDI